MKVIHGRATGLETVRMGATFTGDVWSDPVLPSTDDVTINTIVFTPSARTFWHHHPGGQLLVVVAGEGRICTAGENPVRLRAGDTVWVPPGERHWHGAGPSSLMSHLAISLGATQWSDEVTAAEYATECTD